MRMLGAILGGGLTALVLALPCHGGMDRAITESGSATLSGGRGQIESWGAAGVLLTANNHLDTAGLWWSPDRLGLIDAMLGVDPDNRNWMIGFIMQDMDGVHYTYDRLARVPVLQVLGRDDETGAPTRSMVESVPPLPRPTTYGANGHSARGGPSGRGGGEGGGQIVPEPAALVLLALGALAVFGGRAASRSRMR